MKRTVITMLTVACSFISQAQQSGKVTYTETMKMEIRTDDAEADAFTAMLPKEQKFERVLYFTPEASLYKNIGEQSKTEEREYQEGNARMMFKVHVPDEQYYLDIANRSMVQQRDVMGRKFLIESPADGALWKLTGKQTKILNYPCQEAVMQDGDQKVTAWFTPAIPVGTGPHKFNSLPGLILKLEMDEGRVVMEASNIDLSVAPKEEIKKPKEGKKMTQKEFRAMMDERMKERGGDGNVIIKVTR